MLAFYDNLQGHGTYFEVILDPRVVDIFNTVNDWSSSKGDCVLIRVRVRYKITNAHWEVERELRIALEVFWR